MAVIPFRTPFAKSANGSFSMLFWSKLQQKIVSVGAIAFISFGVHFLNSVGVVGGVSRPNWIDLKVVDLGIFVGVEGGVETPTTASASGKLSILD